MSSDINNRLDSLEQLLTKTQKSYRKNMKLTIICYIILVIFVICYTSFIMYKVKELATPSTVAELITIHVQNKLPELTSYLSNNSEKIANDASEQAVNYALSVIPTLGGIVEHQLDKFSDDIIAKISEEYIPVLNEYFKLHEDEFMSTIENLSDEQTAIKLTQLMTNNFNKELTIIGDQLYLSSNSLEKSINAITTKPNSELTQQEFAKKELLIYWMFLIKNQKYMN